MKNIVLLGATGSIGKSCLSVIRQNKEDFHLYGIGFGSNVDKAQEIIQEFNPNYIFAAQSQADRSHNFWQVNSNILSNEDELQGLIQDPNVDIVIFLLLIVTLASYLLLLFSIILIIYSIIRSSPFLGL